MSASALIIPGVSAGALKGGAKLLGDIGKEFPAKYHAISSETLEIRKREFNSKSF